MTPDLSWSASTDPDGDSVTYDVYLDKSSSPTTSIAQDLSSTTFSVTSSLSGSTTYYWKVVAKDGKGGTTTSETWSFTTKLASVYETDFTTDPGWSTSDNSLFYWSSGQQAYYMKRINIDGGGNYAVKDVGVNMAGKSFRLEWDIDVASVDYACDMRFGLFDSDMNAQENGSYIWVIFTNEDRGYQVLVAGMGSDNVGSSVWTAGTQFSCNVWYHVTLTYDGATGGVVAAITNRDSGAVLRTMEMTCSGFASDMDRVGTSDIRTGSYQVPGAQSSGYVDNVALYVYGDSNNPPSVPQLSSPTNGSTAIAVTPDLSWSASTDPDGDSVTYDVYLDQSTSPVTCIAQNLSSTTFHVTSSLAASTEYYWRIVAKDGSGGRSSSATWGFMTGSSFIYSTDFSSDPGWSTSDASLFYWSSGQQAYYMKRINIDGGGNYAVKDVGMDMAGRSFCLEWDMEAVSIAYAGGIQFGLFDTDMNAQESGSYVWVVFAHEDRGDHVFLSGMGTDNVAHSVWTTGNQYSSDVWYHVVLAYDSSSGSVTAVITNRDSGAVLRTMEMTCGSFASDMDRVGTSDIRTGTYQVPGAQSSGYVDNVVLYVY